MIVTAKNLKELDCSYEIVKDCTLKDGTTLRRGTEFIIDDCNSRNEVCMHFPITENNNYYSPENTNKEIWISAAHMQLISKVKFEDVVNIDKKRHNAEKDLSITTNQLHKEREMNKSDTEELQSETKKKQTYLKTIKELSKRYDIPKDEIYEIVNTIYSEKDIGNQRTL